MTDFGLSSASLKNMEGVHPDLVAVVKRAIELTSIDFGVTEGVRAYERQCELYRDKHTTTLNSKHLLQDSGYGHAIDLVAYVDGKPEWERNKYYGPVTQAFFTAAIEQGTQIKAGHLWLGFQDSVHIELDGNYY